MPDVKDLLQASVERMRIIQQNAKETAEKLKAEKEAQEKAATVPPTPKA